MYIQGMEWRIQSPRASSKSRYPLSSSEPLESMSNIPNRNVIFEVEDRIIFKYLKWESGTFVLSQQ